jgi:hypothetical protein
MSDESVNGDRPILVVRLVVLRSRGVFVDVMKKGDEVWRERLCFRSKYGLLVDLERGLNITLFL